MRSNKDGKRKFSVPLMVGTALVLAGITAGCVAQTSYGSGYRGGNSDYTTPAAQVGNQAGNAVQGGNGAQGVYNTQTAAGADTAYQVQEYAGIDIALLPKEDISAAELAALESVLNDEYRAEAIYQAVIDKFGDVRPFTNIIGAEQQHIDALVEIYNKYDLPVPENTWVGNVPVFDTLEEACSAGVTAEIDNAAMYDRLFEDVDNQDITAVFTSLRDASQYNHLPAFERCAARY